MRKLKVPKEPIEVKHIHTTGVELIRGEFREQIQMQRGGYSFERRAITNHFLVNGKEWKIRSVCCVEVPEIPTRKYDEANHRNLNRLILIQANDLLNRLIGSRYNEVELGVKDKFGKITVHREFQFQHASGSYFSDNKLDLEYSQNAQYFEIGDGFEPHFKLLRRVY